MKKTMVFVDISTNRIQHEFFIYLFCGTIIETPEIFVFFYISKMSFRLDRTNLTIQDSFLALNICMGFLLQFFPLLIYLHDFIFIRIFFWIIFIQTFGFVFTAATICTSIYLQRLRITILLFFFCADMSQFPSIMTDIIKFIFVYLRSHVIILADVFCIGTRFSLFMILQFYVACDFILF